MTVKDVIETAQAAVTIVAIVIGGIWTHQVFLKERQNYPHANIEQRTSHVALPNKSNLVRVGIDLTNTGTSLLVLNRSVVRIQQILPAPPCSLGDRCALAEVDLALRQIELDSDRFSWPMIAQRKKEWSNTVIEPGERDSFDFEFALPAEVKVIRIYTNFDRKEMPKGSAGLSWFMSLFHRERTDPPTSWSASSYYEIGKPKENKDR